MKFFIAGWALGCITLAAVAPTTRSTVAWSLGALICLVIIYVLGKVRR